MRRFIEQKLPAGLLDENCEFFANGDNVFVLYMGRVLPFEKFPAVIEGMVYNDMQKFPDALSSLTELGIEDPKERMKQYVRCRFGGFDGDPDMAADSELKHTEYWECGLRGKCSHEGKLCPSIKVENGYLTKREIEVLQLIAQGELDKNIADKLGISPNTITTHKKNIQSKTGLINKADFTAFAIRKNLIS